MKTFQQIRRWIEESVAHKQPLLPPTMLLRRVAIRSFPDGKQVAIYKDANTGETYAIPPIQ